jgi:hypothetical protein
MAAPPNQMVCMAVCSPDAEPLYGHIRMNKDSDSGRVLPGDDAS